MVRCTKKTVFLKKKITHFPTPALNTCQICVFFIKTMEGKYVENEEEEIKIEWSRMHLRIQSFF